MYQFEWDNKKNISNQEKHDVSFEEAESVFFDENAWLEYDNSHSVNEDRFRLLGMSSLGRVLLVVHCVREEDIIRIISSRKATAIEAKEYTRRIYDE